jgi:TRAP transporter TAXI family solute receptor
MILNHLKFLSVIALTTVALPLSAQDWTPGDNVSLRMAASQPVHAIYPISVGFKEIIEREVPGISIALTATQGGLENARLLSVGEVELANGNSLAAYSLRYGKFAADGEDPQEQLVALFPSYTWEIGTMVPADSDIQTFRDLVGKRIAMGPIGSGAEATASQTLTAMGLADDDFENVQRSAVDQMFGALSSGMADAVIWGTAHPTGRISEQAATRGLRFVPFAEADMEMVTQAYPYFHAGFLRDDLYEGQEGNALWTGGATHFWATTSLPDDLAYAMVKAVWENKEELVIRHVSQEFLNEELVRMQAVLMDFHPGAQRYFVEIGILEAL